MTLPYEYTTAELHERRERVFLVLAGIFLGTLAMLNILGISRFVDFSFTLFGTQIPFIVAVGVLPYPITFLCTDLVSEFYGRRRANFLVLVGLLLNLWVIAVLWVAGVLPPQPESLKDGLPDTTDPNYAFFRIRQLTFGAVAASMIAYLAAQFCDVYVFHFWKRLTKGKHLWLRNNASTMTSQIVDTVSVILITHFYANALPVDDNEPIWPQLFVFIASGYVFKFAAALIDTPLIYLLVAQLSKYLQINPYQEHHGWDDTLGATEGAKSPAPDASEEQIK